MGRRLCPSIFLPNKACRRNPNKAFRCISVRCPARFISAHILHGVGREGPTVPSQPIVRSKHTCLVSLCVGVDVARSTLPKILGYCYHAMVIILRSELFLGWSSDEESPRHSAFPQDPINVLSRTNPSNWSSSYISTPTHSCGACTQQF